MNFDVRACCLGYVFDVLVLELIEQSTLCGSNIHLLTGITFLCLYDLQIFFCRVYLEIYWRRLFS